jgi:TonB family protein
MGETQYESFMYTKFRGYFIGGTLTAGSPEALDQVAAALAQISFRDDVPNPKCTLGPDDGPRMGVIGGIISSKPGAASNSGPPPRVRVSATVSEGLVIKKVQPQYPEAARKDRIQGTVVLEASIDVNGNVEGTTLISGDALLAPSAIEAVKEWKYKPYTLNGQPAKIETQVRVVFTPPEN